MSFHSHFYFWMWVCCPRVKPRFPPSPGQCYICISPWQPPTAASLVFPTCSSPLSKVSSLLAYLPGSVDTWVGNHCRTLKLRFLSLPFKTLNECLQPMPSTHCFTVFAKIEVMLLLTQERKLFRPRGFSSHHPIHQGFCFTVFALNQVMFIFQVIILPLPPLWILLSHCKLEWFPLGSQ